MPVVKRFQKQLKLCICGTSHLDNYPAEKMIPALHLALIWQSPDCLLWQHASQEGTVIWTVPVTAHLPNTSAYQALHSGCSLLNTHLLLSAPWLSAGQQHGHLKHAE